MAFNVNYRVLMFLLGMVIILNVIQILVSIKHRSKSNDLRHLPIVFDLSGNRANGAEKEDDENPPPITHTLLTTPVDNGTCPNTDLTGEDEVQESTMCPQIPPGLGPEPLYPVSTDWVPLLLNGGYYKNRKCLTQQSVAIIVPFNGLQKHILHFLSHLHPFMIKQQADYQVFVIDYDNKSLPLPRGKLFNVGFMEALKHRRWQCMVFHEPNMVPLDSRNLYRCNWYPKQLVDGIANIQINENKTFQPVIGGALALTPEQFSKVNGFSNHIRRRNVIYYDFHKRLQYANYTLERTEPGIGKYKTLVEPMPIAINETMYTSTESPFHLIDGLSTLTYSVLQIDYQTMYTYIQVGGNSEDQEQRTNSKILDVLLSHVLQISVSNQAATAK